MRTFRIYFSSISLLLFLTFGTLGLSQNNALHFDGGQEYVEAQSPLTGNADFTVEGWFKNENTANSGQVLGHIISWAQPGLPFASPRLQILDVQGKFSVYDDSYMSNMNVAPFLIDIRDGKWHCWALTKSGNMITIYLDGASHSYTTGVIMPFDLHGTMTIGSNPTHIGPSWNGEMDEMRIWDYARTAAELNQYKRCELSGTENGLVTYYNFNQGAPAGINDGSIMNGPPIVNTLSDKTNGSDGDLFSFSLIGTKSNWIKSTSPFIIPILTDVNIFITNYYTQTMLLNEICNEDPAHFKLTQPSHNGHNPIFPTANTKFTWQYTDTGGPPWINLSGHPYFGYNFPVPQGEIKVDCNNNLDGHVNRKYRVKFVVYDTNPLSMDSCEYISNEYDLKICCPIQPCSVTILPNNPVCEGETMNLQIQLNCIDAFVNTPAGDVSIKWSVNGNLLPVYNNMIGFSLTNYVIDPVSIPSDICFVATISNCGGKSEEFQACIHVDPEPICGLIEGKPQPPNLMIQSVSPNPAYTICRGDDATIGMLLSSDFKDCIPTWEYSFDNTNWIFLAEGSISNPVLNTNALPWDYLWNTVGDKIYFRIACLPLSIPSGCEPCYSDTLEIQIVDIPEPPIIGGVNQLCTNSISLLSISSLENGVIYSWYEDNVVISSSQSYQGKAGSCYWVVATNSCGSAMSNIHCIKSCNIIPIISCPLVPNDCACIGDPITLTAADSDFNCLDASNLTYLWNWIDRNNIQQSSTSISITDIPADLGTEYFLIVTDTVMGCTTQVSKNIIPCDKNQ